MKFEIILVEDGGNDSTWDLIEALATTYGEVTGIQLSRNAGQHAALLAGVRDAKFDVCVTIDDDLQFLPEEIQLLLSEMERTNSDVVYGVPTEVEQSIVRRQAGRLIRTTLRRGLNVAEAPDFSPFRAFKTALRNGFEVPVGPNVSLDALLSWSASRYSSVPIAHQERRYGRSNYTLGRLLRHALDIATGYSAAPLRLASALGLLTAAFGFGLLSYVIIEAFLTGKSVPGFRMMFAGITILSGAQLICLGLIGEYLSRMHFRIMGRPTYTVRTRTPQQ